VARATAELRDCLVDARARGHERLVALLERHLTATNATAGGE